MLVAALLVSMTPAAPARADVSAPALGDTVSGVVDIHEDRGGTGPCGTPTSRIQVTRVADGAVVFEESRNGGGGWTASWNSVGEPLGDYRIDTYARDSRRSGFLNLGCTVDGEYQLDSVTVTLENRVAAQISLPASVVTGEPLPIDITARDAATGQPIDGEREIAIAVADLGEQTVTTDEAGSASTMVDLPDLPRGPLEVTATVDGDDRFLSGDGAAATTLTRRSTLTFYQGDTRGDPGDTVRLSAQVVDATPDSDRHGEPVADVPVELRFEDASETATTTASGRAAAPHELEGPSRLVEAGASFAGDETWQPSDDEVTFYVGDAAAQETDEEHATTGGLTRLVGGLLGGVGTVVEETTTLLTDASDLLGELLDGADPVGDGLEDVLDLADEGLLHLLSESELREALDVLLGELGDGVGHAGDPVDQALDQILDQLAQAGPLGDAVDTVRFDWRSVHVTDDGSHEAREFGALMGVPEPLDVTGDGTPDVLANLTLSSGVAALDLSGVDGPLGVDLDPDGDAGVVPRLEIARLPGAPDDLPLSLQAIVSLPDMDEEMRVGYDTRESDAPEGFRADLLLGDDGVGMQLASRSDVPMTLTGAIVPEDAADETDLGGGEPRLEEPLEAPAVGTGEQRFAVGFDPAPRDARLGLELGGDAQDLSATFSTDEPTVVDVAFVDDDGADELFFLDGVVDAVDGDLSLGLETGDEGDLGVSLTGDDGLDRLSVQGTGLADGRVEQDLLLALTDVPSEVTLDLEPDGTAGLTATEAIGLLEVGFATDREIALLDEEAFLHLVSEGTGESVAARLPGVASLSMGAGETIELDLEMAATPLRALVRDGDLTLDAEILDAPESLHLAVAADGEIEIEGSDPMEEVTVTASDETGILRDATELHLRIEDVPSLLSIGMADEGVRFETGGQALGLLEILGSSGPEPTLPEEGDGLSLTMTEEDFVVAGRISGLRTIGAVLDGAPELELDTVAEQVFAVDVQTDDLAVTAEIDHLVPQMQLRLVDDGSGAMGLEYSAAEPTNSVSFDLDGLVATISDPMPAELEICMADDEACLPEIGIEDPAVGSIRFAASEYTTLDLTDPSGEMSADGLRLRQVDLTGDLDLEVGGDLYLDTTELGDHCPEFGCVHPVESGNLTMAMGDVEIAFQPGGFAATEATIALEVDTLFGQPVGVSQVGQDGRVFCGSDTTLEATAYGIPLLGEVTLDLTDGICDSSEPLPEEDTTQDEPEEGDGDAPEDPGGSEAPVEDEDGVA